MANSVVLLTGVTRPAWFPPAVAGCGVTPASAYEYAWRRARLLVADAAQRAAVEQQASRVRFDPSWN